MSTEYSAELLAARGKAIDAVQEMLDLASDHVPDLLARVMRELSEHEYKWHKSPIYAWHIRKLFSAIQYRGAADWNEAFNEAYHAAVSLHNGLVQMVGDHPNDYPERLDHALENFLFAADALPDFKKAEAKLCRRPASPRWADARTPHC